MLGLGINTVIDTGWSSSSLLNVLAGNFQARVLADGGEVENMVCLNKDLIDLTNGSDSLLIDRYASPAAAYSLRKLRRDYLGPAIRVRRNDNDEEQDIFFNSDGSLDTASLETFCAGTDGYVDTWYDQANGNDATQDEPNQPKIYDSSTGVVTENGKPALEFDGSNDYFTKAFTLTNPVSHFVVAQAPNTGDFILDGYVATNRNSLFKSSANEIRLYNSAPLYQTHIDGTQAVFSSISNGGSSLLAVNGSSVTGTLGTNSMDGVTIGTLGNLGPGYYLYGTIQEVVLYGSDETSNRTGIETNINDHYNIYT